MERFRLTPGIALACLIALPACNEAGAASRRLVRDSAGVQILESTRPLWNASNGWHLADEPSVEIGGMDVAPDYAVYQVRGALRLEGGRIIVADGGSSQLKLYGPDGQWLKSIGRSGEGPGEFRRIWDLERFGPDSLILWDSGNLRVSVHTIEGEFTRTFKMSGNQGDSRTYMPGPRLLVLDDRSILGIEWLNMAMAPEGTFRPVVMYFRFSPEGTKLGGLVSVPFTEFQIRHFGGALNNMPGRPTAMQPLLFGKHSDLTVSGGTVWVGTENTYSLDAYASEDGRLTRIIRNLAYEPRIVTDDQVRAERDRRSADVDSMVTRMPQMASSGWLDAQRENLNALRTPEHLPAYQDIRADRAGNIWVQEYAMPGTEALQWTVFDSEGQMLGTVDLPSGFTVFEIGNDYVLGDYIDDLGVEYVRVYALIKPESGGE